MSNESIVITWFGIMLVGIIIGSIRQRIESRADTKSLYRHMIYAAYKAGSGYAMARVNARIAISVMNTDQLTQWNNAIEEGQRVNRYDGYFELG